MAFESFRLPHDEETVALPPKAIVVEEGVVPERVEFDGYAFDTSSGHFASGHRRHRFSSVALNAYSALRPGSAVLAANLHTPHAADTGP